MWAKIDDGYFDNTKVLKVPGPARFLHLASMIWAAAHSNGTGILPKQVLATLGAQTQIVGKELDAASKKLVSAGLWEDEDDDWVVHDFVPYTPPKEREKNAARLAAWREKKRQSNGVTAPPETALQASSNGTGNAGATGTPVPGYGTGPETRVPTEERGSSSLRSEERARRA